MAACTVPVVLCLLQWGEDQLPIHLERGNARVGWEIHTYVNTRRLPLASPCAESEREVHTGQP